MSVYRFLTLCGTVGLLLIFCSANNPAQQPGLQKPTPLPEAIEKKSLGRRRSRNRLDANNR
jgi:hypothetical protein